MSCRYLLNKAKKESISFSNLSFWALVRFGGIESTKELRAFLIWEAATFELAFSKAKVDCDLMCFDILMLGSIVIYTWNYIDAFC